MLGIVFSPIVNTRSSSKHTEKLPVCQRIQYNTDYSISQSTSECNWMYIVLSFLSEQKIVLEKKKETQL